MNITEWPVTVNNLSSQAMRQDGPNFSCCGPSSSVAGKVVLRMNRIREP